MSENEKRKLIKDVRSDSTLSDYEKSQKVQEIIMGQHNTNKASQPLESNSNKTCEHYEKKCYKFYFQCCNVYDPCVRCHWARKSCEHMKFNISTIVCTECDTEQPPGDNCTNCGIQFAPCHCSVCNIWTVSTITHCDDCGICRVGRPDDLYHCHNCHACFASRTKEHHQCEIDFADVCCVLCNESIFFSRDTSGILPCKHLIHHKCLEDLVNHEQYRCPQCKKSMANMSSHWEYLRLTIASHPIPLHFLPIAPLDIVRTPYGKFRLLHKREDSNQVMWEGEFIDWSLAGGSMARGILNAQSVALSGGKYKEIYCNDCEQKCITAYHYYGLECQGCHGFNTQE